MKQTPMGFVTLFCCMAIYVWVVISTVVFEDVDRFLPNISFVSTFIFDFHRYMSLYENCV